MSTKDGLGDEIVIRVKKDQEYTEIPKNVFARACVLQDWDEGHPGLGLFYDPDGGAVGLKLSVLLREEKFVCIDSI